MQLLLAISIGIIILLVLIIKLRINAFISLLIAAITVGLIAGMPATQIIGTITKGMGGTLGYVAVIVGLGSLFGAVLEHSGGAGALAQWLIKQFGEKKAPTALLLAGFIIAIPVFFDVAFIIMIPILHALSRKMAKPLLYFALPLLAGLAITHSFVPPTPGPVAVADILKADLGWVILLGLVVGIPTALVCGLWLSKYLTKDLAYKADSESINAPEQAVDTGLVKLMLILIALPIVMILSGTVCTTLIKTGLLSDTWWVSTLIFIGHPFVALIITTLLTMYFAGIQRGMDKETLFDISNKGLIPAGSIILITGAGGVFKQMLIDTGAGKMIADAFAGADVYLVILAFVVAVLVRIAQGSATVAMITAAGIVAPLMMHSDVTEIQKALIVLAIAGGSVCLSHVNDSGFWLVNRYLNISVQQTFRTWSVLTTAIAVFSFLVVLLLYWFS